MTDTPSSTDPADDDLLASLYLDGEATADERATVEADPRLMARVRAFEAVAGELANVAPPPDLGRMQISAALDLFDSQQAPLAETQSAAATAPAAATVSSLDARRQRKQSRGVPTWLSAAAALALVVGGLAFVSTRSDESDDVATADFATDSEAESLASGANRTFDEDDSAATEEAETTTAEAMEDDAMADDAMDEEALEEESNDVAADEAGDAGADVALAPIPLDGLDASTAAGYLELLTDQTLQPIEASPCAGSPLVEGLFGVDSFISVVFEGEIASLLLQEGLPSTAVIVGATCEIELE